MHRPAKSSKAIPAVGFLVLLILGFAGQAFADKKPKFVYVANSGASASGDRMASFQVAATAICGGSGGRSDCASPISISGTFTVDMTTGQAIGGTMYMSDPSDLASSPLAVPFDSTAKFPGDLALFFLVPGRTSQQSPSYVQLIFPFLVFPASYSGGPLCTVSNAPDCGVSSGAEIGTADASSSLFNSTMNGTNIASANMTSGSVTLTGSSGGSQGSGSVSGYAIDGTTGVLSPVPGAPFAAGLYPRSVAVDPSNKFVYVANKVSNNVSAFAVNGTTGALSQIPGSQFAAGLDPDWVTVDPSGKFVYVTNQLSNNISAYMLNSATGALTSVNGSPFAADVSPISLTVDPLGKFVYVTSSDLNVPTGSVLEYTIDSVTGALTPRPDPGDKVNGPLATAVDPSGKFLFEIDAFHTQWGVNVSTINSATGALTGTLYGSGSVYPGALAVHPSGKFLYVTDDRRDFVGAFTIDSTTGNLALVPGGPSGGLGLVSGPYATGSSPESIAVDPSGKFAYVGNTGGNNISAYTIDGTTGALAPIAGSPFAAGVRPASVAIASASTLPFDTFSVKAGIDEDRMTSFRVEGFFRLGKGSGGIYPLSENVQLQVGTFTTTIPAGSFRQEGRHEFEFEGRINDVDLKVSVYPIEDKEHGKGKDHDRGKDRDKGKDQVGANDFIFTAEGNGNILAGIANPVAVGLTIGDDEGSTTVKADIDK